MGEEKLLSRFSDLSIREIEKRIKELEAAIETNASIAATNIEDTIKYQYYTKIANLQNQIIIMELHLIYYYGFHVKLR